MRVSLGGAVVKGETPWIDKGTRISLRRTNTPPPTTAFLCRANWTVVFFLSFHAAFLDGFRAAVTQETRRKQEWPRGFAALLGFLADKSSGNTKSLNSTLDLHRCESVAEIADLTNYAKHHLPVIRDAHNVASRLFCTTSECCSALQAALSLSLYLSDRQPQ